MENVERRNPPVVVASLSLFWLYYSTLGSFSFSLEPGTTTLISISLLALVFAFGWTSRAPLDLSKEFLTLLPVLAIIGSQLLAAWQAGFNVSDRGLYLGVNFAAFALLFRFYPNLILRSFYLASSIMAIAGWPIELFGLNSFHYKSGFPINPLDWRWMGLQNHPNIAGLTMALLFAIAVIKYRNIPIATLALVNIVLAEHRGGLIGVVLVLGYVSINRFSAWSSSKRLVIGSMWVFGLLIAPFGLTSRLGTDDISTGRGTIWEICLNQYQKSPIYGNGPNAVTRLFGLDISSTLTPFHCHNQFLDDLVNFGWIGALFPTFALFMTLILAMRYKKHVLVGMTLAVGASWFVESPFRLFGTQPGAFTNLLLLLMFTWGAQGPLAAKDFSTQDKPRDVTKVAVKR